MKHIFLVILLTIFSCTHSIAQTISLSNEAEISLITCDVSPEVYAMYGHSAIRVADQSMGIDYVFNYGLFSFSEPNFVYRFAKGRTDYLLGGQSYASFVKSYKRSQRSMSEQKLNLTSSEKEKLFQFLQWNILPENAEYRYNFLYDNCATRVRDAIENCLEGELIYGSRIGNLQTFRDLVDHYQRVSPWTNFGIHLLLGSPTDINADLRNQLFLPPYLELQFAQSNVRRGDEVSPLCQAQQVIYQAPESPSISFAQLHMPSITMALLLLFYALLTIKQRKQHAIGYFFDYFWLLFNGIIGLILTWFFFFSELPAMQANYNLLWACPLNIGLACIWMKKSWRNTLTSKLWLIPALMSMMFLASSPLIPQAFPLPIYLIVFTSAMRSVFIYLKLRSLYHSTNTTQLS